MTRAKRWFYSGASLLGFAIGLWGYSSLADLSGPPANLSHARLDYPLSVDGATIGSFEQLLFQLESYPAGATVEIRSASGGLSVTLERALTRFHSVIILVSGLFFLCINLIVFCPRIDRGFVRDFYWATLLYGIAILVNGLYPPRFSTWLEGLTGSVWIVCLTILPVLFIHMTLCFPGRSPFLDRRLWFMRILWIVAGLLIALQVVGYWIYLGDPDPGTWRGIIAPELGMRLFLVLCVTAGFLILFRRSRRFELAREREQMKWFLWGFSIGVGPYVFLRTLPQVFGLESPVGREFDHICEMTIPIAFTLSVIRHKFLDIDLIIRRSLIYTVLAGVLASVYFLLAVLVGHQVRAWIPSAGRAVDIVAAVIPVALFVPTRRMIGRMVDRTVFKIRTGYKEALASLRESLQAASTGGQLVEALWLALHEQLQPKRLVVCVNHPKEGWTRAGETGEPIDLSLVPWEDLPPRTLAMPNSTSRPELEQAAFPAALEERGIHVAAPLVVELKAAGWLLLGEKGSERRYVEEDLDLIQGAAVAGAAAWERIILAQRVAEESMARQRLHEIDLLKSEFLSRVSHDLRTPLTSIRWSVENLLDGVAGPVDERQREYLAAIKTSAGQLGRLVNNLVEISRLEMGSARVEIEPVDLPALAREVMTGLRPLALSRGIAFDLRPQEGLRPVRGSRDKLYEVLANLLENAIKYAPDNTAIEISIERDGERAGRQRLTVRDHGPGLAEGEEAWIFERFRQGRASPHSQPGGFGLGLYVVRSFVHVLGGSVEASNHPDGGACFRCTLPDWNSGEGEGS